MKRTLLSIVALFAANIMVAQCLPNPEYADETFGIWPSPEEGFEVGVENQYYEQIVNFKIPDDPGDIPGMPSFGTIESVEVTAIQGLPDGLIWECNSHTAADCVFFPNTPGCAIISGVPTESDTFALSIVVLAILDVAPNGVPYTFEDFEMVIEPNPSSVHELSEFGLKLNQNAPNPFSDQTVIEYSLDQPVMVDFAVYNLLGKVVHTKTTNSTPGMNRIELSASSLNLSPGIYLYSLTVEGQSVTRKMVVK